MEPRSNNKPAEWRFGCSGHSTGNGEADPDDFYLAETDRHHRILAFLETSPNSSLLAIVQHLWPNFLNLPADERARAWFGVKTQLLALEKLRVLQCEHCETDVSVWSIREEPTRRELGDE